MSDWQQFFMPAVAQFLGGGDPYLNSGFANPPYVLLLLVPLSILPYGLIVLLPLMALLALAVRAKQPRLLLLVGTSFPFIACSLYGNLDWLVMIGVAIGGRWGVVLDTFKPQAGLFAIVAEIAKKPCLKDRLLLLLPLGLLTLLFGGLLTSWLHWLPIVGASNNGIRNFSLFPWSIPLGLIALRFAWIKQDALWGVVASLALSPYFYIHSLLPLLYLASSRSWRLGLVLNLCLWFVVALIILKVIPIDL